MSENKYQDIINMPHHQSPTRKHMSLHDRAAQFSPFSALTGHSEAIEETARFTENAPDLDDNTKEILNGKLQMLLENTAAKIPVTITFFRPDSKKKGGAYIRREAAVTSVDSFRREVVMSDGTVIPVDSIVEIECSLYNEYE